MSGRTTYLVGLSNLMVLGGLKVCFIGCSTELENSPNLRNVANIVRFIRGFGIDRDEYNLKMLESIREISYRDKYDFILIDDFDQLSKKCIELLKSITIKKIVTCPMNGIPILNEPISTYRLSDNKIDEYDFTELSRLLIRDKKIKEILK